MFTTVALCLMAFSPEDDARAVLVLSALSKKESPPLPKEPEKKVRLECACDCGCSTGAPCVCLSSVKPPKKLPEVPPPPVVKQEVKTQVITVPVLTHRQPMGHTHTCVNGHTWDHAMTAGHNCPICGAAQYVQDRTPRMVTVRTTTTRVVPVTTQATLPIAVPGRATTQYPANPFQSGGGCASGNCPNARR